MRAALPFRETYSPLRMPRSLEAFCKLIERICYVTELRLDLGCSFAVREAETSLHEYPYEFFEHAKHISLQAHR